MKNLLLTMLLLFTFQASAQEDLEPREIQDFGVLNVWLPFQIGLDGNVEFFKDHPAESFVFSPIFQVGFQWKKARFNPPLRTERFSLEANPVPSEWLEIYRRRVSGGAGIGVLLRKGLSLGLIPFKGAKQRLVRKVPVDTKAPSLSLLPKKLSEVKSWEIGDQGSFETFGGIQAEIAATTGLIDFASVGLQLQSEFLIQIKKISSTEISLGIYEGNSKHRELSLGPLVANYSLANFSGKRFGAEFVLDLDRDANLYSRALAGDLRHLQESLPHRAQRLSFYGSSRTLFIGIPELIGKNIRKGVLNTDDDGELTSLYFNSNKNDGIFLPRRDIHRFTFLSEKETVFFWASDLSKAKGKILDKYFVSLGRRLGLKDFNVEIPKDAKYGNVMTQLGISLKNEDLPRLKSIDFEVLEANYQDRCEDHRLNCRKEGRRRKILRKLTGLLKEKEVALRKGLGTLLMKNPSLLHSILKTLGLRTEGYYLFLSDRFRSLEGKAEVLL